MNATAHLLLANAASPGPGGVLSLLGLGWRITGPSPLPQFSVIVVVDFPDPSPPGGVHLRVELRDEHGAPVTQGPEAEPVVIKAQIDPLANPVERPERFGARATLQVELGPGMLLEPGYYRWAVLIDGQLDERAGQDMYVRATSEDFAVSA